MMKQNKKENTNKRTICGYCTSVLSDFQQNRCLYCNFVTQYTDRSGTVYFIREDYRGMFRTHYRKPDSQRKRVYLEHQPQYSFAEAQSFLNHYAAQHGWKEFKPGKDSYTAA